jgi:hypothetical protein
MIAPNLANSVLTLCSFCITGEFYFRFPLCFSEHVFLQCLYSPQSEIPDLYGLRFYGYKRIWRQKNGTAIMLVFSNNHDQSFSIRNIHVPDATDVFKSDVQNFNFQLVFGRKLKHLWKNFAE